jgi:iron complex outermembrane receptor protein
MRRAAAGHFRVRKKIMARLTALVLLAIPARARQQPPSQQQAQTQQQDLTTLSIEDLMNITVTSVSKKEQTLSRTAAAIFVITAEDIRRSGATSIPDVLRIVPGLDVAQINGSTWAISARGFNQQFSNKLLVMIDGRVVYTSTFAGVFWDTISDFPLEDIARIEVIRGPGGTIWGANAVDGVINILTKKASETRGGMVVAEGGNINQEGGLVQYGGELKQGTDYRVDAKYFNNTNLFSLDGQNGADGWHQLRGGFRMDSALSPKDSWMVEGDIATGREGELGFVLPSITSPGFVAESEEINIANGSLESVWNHTYSARSDTSLQISFDRHKRDDPQNPETRDTLDLGFQHHIAVGGRQDVVWGLGYRYTTDLILGSLTVAMNPASSAHQVFDGFFQDEIALVPDRLYLTGGMKLEHNDYTGFEVMPSGRLAWEPDAHNMFWLAVSRALRAPSRNDTNLVLNIGDVGVGPGGVPELLRLYGNPQYQDERLIAYELGYRTAVSSRLSIDLAAYYNDYNNLQTTEPGTPFAESTPAPAHLVIPLTYENLMYGETHGIEIAANWKVADRWTLAPGYAFEQLHMHTDPSSADTQTGLFVEGAAPRNSAQIRSHFDLSKNVTFDAAAYAVSRLIDQGPTSNVTIPAYTRLDAELTWKPWERVSFSLVGQNLLKNRHLEFEDVNGALQSSQIRRGGYAKVAWTF